MKKTAIITILLLVCGIYSLFSAHLAYASNVQVTDVQLLDVGNTPNTARIQFTLSQENTFGDLTYDGKQYSDYVWVFVKYATVPVSESVGYKHATLIPGVGCIGAYNSTTGEGIGTDNTGKGKGVFIKAYNARTPVESKNIFSVLWDFGTDEVLATDNIKVKVCAIEMVKIPEGPFYYDVWWAHGQAGAFTVGFGTANNYGGGAEMLVSGINDKPVGSATDWPNGYSSFYVMKYELSQGQYTDFLNMLPASVAVNRFNTKAGSLYQYTITYDSTKAYGERYSVGIAERACNYLDWDDALDYASWSALRPMTEMEFEKAARGTTVSGILPVNNGSFVFSADYIDADALNPVYMPLGHLAPYVAPEYYANYSANGEYIDGPTNVGNYVSGDIVRTNTSNVRQDGTSVYGVADLSGNLWERVIGCVSPAKPLNGDGIVRALSDYNSSLGWPGLNTKFSTYIGHGLRGGGFTHSFWDLQISGRGLMSTTGTNGHYYDTASYPAGFRGVRTLG